MATFVLAFLLLAVGSHGESFFYRTYTETMQHFANRERDHTDIIKTWIAQDIFPNINPSGQSWGTCDGQPCKTLIARISKVSALSDTTPELFVSGALHGNEALGPVVSTELADFLCKQYAAGQKEIQHLVDTRAVWIVPMTNAEGFSKGNREENSVDPNRDFAYLQTSANCMKTQAARTVNELFRRHLFQLSITFHGGMRSLTYQWGSRNHLKNQHFSTESPDDYAFRSVGGHLREASGKDQSGEWWYTKYGPHTDVVYYVDGGFEDWSYAASWEASPTPITVCSPTTFGGYAADRTKYKTNSIGTLVYLVEMDDSYKPMQSTLGSKAEIWNNQPGDGHVARNIRMSLKSIEYTVPEVIIKPPTWSRTLNAGDSLSMQFHGLGCTTISSARLLFIPRARVKSCLSLTCDNCASDESWRQQLLKDSYAIGRISGAASCHGLSIWQAAASEGQGLVKLNVAAPGINATEEFCAAVAAEFDQDWRTQLQPDPDVLPRSIASRSRLEEHYTASASDGNMRVFTFRTKLFSVQSDSLTVHAAPPGYTTTTMQQTTTTRTTTVTTTRTTARATTTTSSAGTRAVSSTLLNSTTASLTVLNSTMPPMVSSTYRFRSTTSDSTASTSGAHTTAGIELCNRIAGLLVAGYLLAVLL